MISGSFLRQKILAVLNCLLGEAVPASINQLQHLSKTNKLHLVHNCQLPSLCQYLHTSCIAYRSCIKCHMQYPCTVVTAEYASCGAAMYKQLHVLYML